MNELEQARCHVVVAELREEARERDRLSREARTAGDEEMGKYHAVYRAGVIHALHAIEEAVLRGDA